MSGQQQLFTINGLVDTSKTVWQNLEELAGASAAFVTWDPYTFQYGVVINQPGVSIRSFTDDNIIGAINLTETPFDELYNSAEVRFPNKDIRDKTDTIRYDPPAADRYDFEPDNKLSIQFDFVNDPIQADVIARTELKQSRINKTISFTTDFQQLDLAPGDIIDLTQLYWGWTAKLFRIVEITQTDTNAGEIYVDIVAVEYDADVYNYNDLSRYERTVSTGVPAVKNNAAVQIKNDEGLGDQVGRALETDQGRTAIAAQGVPIIAVENFGYSTSTLDSVLNGAASFGAVIQLATSSGGAKLMQIALEGPQAAVNYTTYIDEVSTARQYIGSVPLYVRVEFSADNITYNLLSERYLEWTSNITSFNLTNITNGFFKITAVKTDTLVLDQDDGVAGVGATLAIGTVATSAAPSGDAAQISFIVLE